MAKKPKSRTAYNRAYYEMTKARRAWLASLTPEQRHEEALRYYEAKQAHQQARTDLVKLWVEFLEWRRARDGNG